MGDEFEFSNDCLLGKVSSFSDVNNSLTHINLACLDNYDCYNVLSDQSTRSDFDVGGFLNHCFASNDRPIYNKFKLEINNTDLSCDLK
jgi:hypothetical protein